MSNLHDWTASTLGHGETMCARCKITNREAAVLGEMNSCPVRPPLDLAETVEVKMTRGQAAACIIALGLCSGAMPSRILEERGEAACEALQAVAPIGVITRALREE